MARQISYIQTTTRVLPSTKKLAKIHKALVSGHLLPRLCFLELTCLIYHAYTHAYIHKASHIHICISQNLNRSFRTIKSSCIQSNQACSLELTCTSFFTPHQVMRFLQRISLKGQFHTLAVSPVFNSDRVVEFCGINSYLFSTPHRVMGFLQRISLKVSHTPAVSIKLLSSEEPTSYPIFPHLTEW